MSSFVEFMLIFPCENISLDVDDYENRKILNDGGSLQTSYRFWSLNL